MAFQIMSNEGFPIIRLVTLAHKQSHLLKTPAMCAPVWLEIGYVVLTYVP